MEDYVVYVCPHKGVKLEAIQEVMTNNLTQYNVIMKGIEVSSDVHEQPLDDETYVGCENRLNAAITKLDETNSKYDLLVSIENGVFTDKMVLTGNCYDACWIFLYNPDNGDKIAFKSSKYPVWFHKKYYDQSKETSNNRTIGIIIEEEFNWDEGTWQEKLIGISRKDIIIKTIEENYFN